MNNHAIDPSLAPAWFESFGKLVLRVSVGILVLMHGVHKLGSGPGGIGKMLEGNGLPAELAYLVYIGEIVAPLMMIFGFWNRLGAALVVVNMIVAIALAHAAKFFSLTNNGGWMLELQGLYLFGALAAMFLGAGRYALAGPQRGLN